MVMSQRLCLLSLLMVLLGYSLQPFEAEAQICQPGRVVKIHVGDTASDAACHYNDIQSALNAVGNCPTQINVTRMHIWNNQHLTTGGKNVTLQGWGDGVTCFVLSQTCGPEICPIPTSTAPLVTLNGSNTPGRVLTISGASSFVTLRHLIITGGLASGGDGGGIGFSGTGRLNLFTSAVNYNNAGYGGGINFRGTGETANSAILTLLNETLIVGNTATVSGGGIRIEGRAQLIVESPRTLITFNTASTGFGGGIEIIGPAQGYIGSPGYNGAPVVHQNEARLGGGIAVVAGTGENLGAELHLYSLIPDQPVSISGNAAAERGGALYLLGHRDGFPSLELGNAIVHIYGARLSDNTAPDGAIAYLDTAFDGFGDPWGSVMFIRDIPSPRGGHGCPEPPCTLMSGNATRTLAGDVVPTGALITLGRDADFQSTRVEFSNNESGYLMRLEPQELNISNTTIAWFRNCLVADNTFAQGVWRAPAGEHWSMRITGCTVVGNTIAAGPVVYAHEGELLLEYSIVDQPGVPVLNQASITNSPFARYLLSPDVSTLPAAIDIIQGTPTYVDGLNGNYRLRHHSLGIDFAPSLAAPGELELDGLPRLYDVAAISNHFGIRDLGAYERNDEPPSEVIFADGFETGSGSSSSTKD